MESLKCMEDNTYDMELVVRFVSYMPIVGQVSTKDFGQRTILLIYTSILNFSLKKCDKLLNVPKS